MSRYYSPYEEALNLAAAKVLTTTTSTNGQAGAAADPPPPGRASYPYTLVRAKNVGMTAILLFARDPAALHHIGEAVVGFGIQDMGNKGAVGLRATWSGAGGSTELTFVATHLAAMEWNLKKRNANWRSIVSGLTFENPKRALPGVFPDAMPSGGGGAPEVQRDGVRPPSPASASSSEGSEEEDADAVTDAEDEAPLLSSAGDHSSSDDPDGPQLTAEHLQTLHSLSVFKPTSHLFLAGDLNYRISTTTPPARSPFPSFYHPREDPLHWSHFLPRDQLTAERAAGRTMHGLTEAAINFGPSYKYDVLAEAEAENAENYADVREKGEVPWRWAPHRWPSWCDRVLYLEVPGWVRRREERVVEVVAYDLLPLMASSDHRPVFLRARVPVLGPEEMRPPAVLGEGDAADPRVVLPVAVDPHAWERRAKARRKELWAGWSMFVWATREGAVLISTLLVVAGVSWWLLRVW